MSVGPAARRIRRALDGTVSRFAGVGLVNTAIDLGLYALLHGQGLPIALANLISTLAGLCFSYVANRRFTFRVAGARPGAREVLVFLATTGAGLWILQPLVIVGATDALVALGVQGGAALLLLPKLAGIAVGVVWNYWWYSRIVFRPSAVQLPGPSAVAVAEVPAP